MEMVYEQGTDLGKNVLKNPKKYSGFMGISILHRFFAPKRMKHYIEWGSKYFTKFAIILVDDPDKYNFQVFRKLDEAKALNKAREISDEIKTSYEKIIDKKGLDNVEIFQFRDFETQKRYKDILNLIEVAGKNDFMFKKELFHLMNICIGNKIEEFMDNNPEKKEEKVTDVLIRYVVEELASLIYFTEIGYPIEIDPTIEFSTKKLLYEKKFQKLYERMKLTQRGHLYLHPKGIEKETY